MLPTRPPRRRPQRPEMVSRRVRRPQPPPAEDLIDAQPWYYPVPQENWLLNSARSSTRPQNPAELLVRDDALPARIIQLFRSPHSPLRWVIDADWRSLVWG